MEGYQSAISGRGFMNYFNQTHEARPGYNAGATKQAFLKIVDPVQQALNEEMNDLRQRAKAFATIPLLDGLNINTRLVDFETPFFAPLYVEVLEGIASAQGRSDWGNLIPEQYLNAKRAIYEGILSMQANG